MNRKLLTILTPSLGPESVLIEHYDWFIALDNPDCKLIIIDQNPSGSSFELESRAEISNNFTYIYNNKRGLSLNRNLALPFVDSEFVIFLDDDARFQDDFLVTFTHFKSAHNEMDIFLCGIVNSDMSLTSYTPYVGTVDVSIGNLERKVNSNGLIVSRRLLNKISFDEDMGVGALHGSCEEIDFVVQGLLLGAHAIYTSDLKVIHPVPYFDSSKALSYGRGHGYFTRKLLTYAFQEKNISTLIFSLKKIAIFFAKLLFSTLGLVNKNCASKFYWCKGFILSFIKVGK